jgi:pyruvate dehydrogenase E1 component beta subunit
VGEDVTYKDALIGEMLKLSSDSKVRFVGYNVARGPQFNDTLTLCPGHCLIETPCAENLIMGLAMGLSLEGFKPIACFERMDFLLGAMDAIVNHLCTLPELSGDQFDFPVVIRTCVGSTKPLDPGPQHTRDYVSAIKMMAPSLRIERLLSIDDIQKCYGSVLSTREPIMLVEYRALYDKTFEGVPTGVDKAQKANSAPAGDST